MNIDNYVTSEPSLYIFYQSFHWTPLHDETFTVSMILDDKVPESWQIDQECIVDGPRLGGLFRGK